MRRAQYTDTFGPTEQLHAYWSIINVAVSLLLTAAVTLLATLITATDVKIRNASPYTVWSLVCFTTTLLINLSQQVSFATTTPTSLSHRRERSDVDMQVAECYLQDNLSQWFTRFAYHRVYLKQLLAP